MAEIEDFQEAEFNQSTHLGSTYKFKKEAQPGVCLALTISWVRTLTKPPAPDTADKIITALVKDFNLSITKQAILTDIFFNVPTATPHELAAKWNSVSGVTGVEFSFDSNGQLVDPLAVAMFGLADGIYMLRIGFVEGGGHAIGLIKVGTMALIFDPNFGIFGTDSEPKLKDFSVALWARYKTVSLTISYWQLYLMTKAQTARDRMLKELAKLK